MAKNWLGLPVLWSGFYPKEVVELAKRAGVTPEEVAKKKGITPGKVNMEYFRRDDVELVYKITEDPENPKMCIFSYITGEFDIIALPAKLAVKRVDEFLGENVIFHKRAIQLTMEPIPFNEEEEDEQEN